MKTHDRRVHGSMVALTALVAAAGLARPALADDEDGKLLHKQPSIVHQPTHWRIPDEWKVRDRVGGVVGVTDDTFQSKNIILKTWLPLSSFPGYPGGSGSGADCWGYTSPSGREYALMGLSWGNGIVEVTDPAAASIHQVVPGGVNSLWRDITVVGTYAYAVSDSSGVGIQVMDLSNIDAGTPTAVQLIRNYSQGGHTTTHTLLSNPQSGYLYACGGNATSAGGFQPVATTPDPTFPTFTGPGWTTQYVHEAQIVNYTSGPYAGHEIAFLFAAGPYYGASYIRCMAIVDITNKAAPQQLSFIAYPGMRFCHQGWISGDRKYLYIDDELDGPGSSNGNVPSFLCRVFDISDLTKPRLCSVFTNGNTAIDHNQYTNGRYLFQSNYCSGMRIWDVINPLKPVEIAWIDTRPEDGVAAPNPQDGATYNGAWGNYPFFNSGTILVSDLERGLFVVKLSILEMTPTGAPPAALAPGQATPVSIQVTPKDATTASVNLMVSVNGGAFNAYAMSNGGSGTTYSGSIPALNAFDRVRYYFVAQTNDAPARSFTWPLTSGEYLNTYVQGGQVLAFSDNFETDQGWTVQNTGITAGAWVRAVPLVDGGPGAVIGDADGSGQCYVTGNTLNADVTGGTTRLLSPAFDLSHSPEARISYSRWLVSLVATVDPLVTEVSNDNGTNWTQVSSISPATGGWQNHTFRVADYVAPTAQTRVRFSLANTDSSTTEGGIDAVSVIAPYAQVCYANCDGSTIAPALNVQDFSCFLNLFASGDPVANCDNSTTAPILNVQDFSCFLNSFAGGCT